MAPELMDDERPRFSRLPADVYALTILLLELITGAVPWAGRSDMQIMNAVIRGRRPDLSGLPRGPFLELIEQGWAEALEDRPTASQALDVLEAVLSNCGGDPREGNFETLPPAYKLKNAAATTSPQVL